MHKRFLQEPVVWERKPSRRFVLNELFIPEHSLQSIYNIVDAVKFAQQITSH